MALNEVYKLKKDQMAFEMGSEIAQFAAPTCEVKQYGTTDKIDVVITLHLHASMVNNETTEKDLTNSCAVLTSGIANCPNLSDSVSFMYKSGEAVKLILKIPLPGDKGYHRFS